MSCVCVLSVLKPLHRKMAAPHGPAVFLDEWNRDCLSLMSSRNWDDANTTSIGAIMREAGFREPYFDCCPDQNMDLVPLVPVIMLQAEVGGYVCLII